MMLLVYLYQISGHSWECMLYSYTSLLCPGGYTKNQGQSSASIFRTGTALSGPRLAISEVERARINQVFKMTCLFDEQLIAVLIIVF